MRTYFSMTVLLKNAQQRMNILFDFTFNGCYFRWLFSSFQAKLLYSLGPFPGTYFDGIFRVRLHVFGVFSAIVTRFVQSNPFSIHPQKHTSGAWSQTYSSPHPKKKAQ